MASQRGKAAVAGRFRYVGAAVVALLLGGCLALDLASLLEPELEEVVLQESAKRTPHRILVLDISGFIAAQPGGPLSLADRCCPDAVKAVLNKAERAGNVEGLILRIDSPGGGVAATDIIYHDIRQFAERTGIPVVASILGMGCSGGYYIAAAADHIVVHPSSVTGSIGVIAWFPRIEELADKIGYDQVVIKSGKMKDMGNPFREMPEEERRVLQTMIDTFYEQFVATVAARRPAIKDPEQLKPIADGRIYTASQAVTLGLADRTGYLDDVIADVKREAGIAHADVITYMPGPTPDATIYTANRAHRLEFNAVKVDLPRLLGPAGPGFYFLWAPGLQ